MLQRLLGVFHGVERLGRLVAAAAALLGLALGLALLDAGAVGEEIFEEARGRLGHPHRAAIALAVELWQQARVIDMGVGQQQEVDALADRTGTA